MAVNDIEYYSCFHRDDLVTIGLHLPGISFAEDSARVMMLDGEKMRLELCGKGFPQHIPIGAGTNVVISRWEGRNLFACKGMISRPVAGRLIQLDLVGRVIVSDRREYARVDVNMNVIYSLPICQELGEIINEWEVLKRCQANCVMRSLGARHGRTKNGPTRVNLSGNGLRFKIRDCLSYGTLLHLKIAIPGDLSDHIHAVGSIVRTRELLPEMELNEYYSTSMAFRVIDCQDRQKLMSYVFAEQRKRTG